MLSPPAALPHVPHLSASIARAGFELNTDRWTGGERNHVLLLHGLGGNSVTWHAVAPALAKELEAFVLAVDLPGFGRSRTEGRPVDMNVLSRVVEAVLRTEARGRRWIIAGNSLGAVLGFELACRTPELVAGVAASAPALPLLWGRDARGLAALSSWIPAALPWLGGRLIARYMSDTGLPGVVDEPIGALFGDPRRLDPGLRSQLLEVSAYRLGWVREAAHAYEQVTRSLGVELLRPGRAERWIRKAACPVLAIRGGKDPIFSEAAWRTLERARPDWQYLTLHDVGHVPQLEAPGEVTQSLVEWAQRLPRS
ncbi:MAG TPA: alpha/beta hydrolase [Polyangiaceae bacterium]|nr:alpha/beta hydrolase [Polyangiaceae bacterium]